MSQPSKQPLIPPEGLDFIQLISEQEDACEAETRARIAKMGKKAPVCLQNLGTALSFLDRAASCFWGCRGGDHLVEYLAGRVCSCSRAALRLLLFGFYDESLSITRSIGEVANLLFLFNQDATALSEWPQLSRKQRKEKFGPVKVRERLETLIAFVPVDDRRYRELCEIATHPTPQTKPQAYNPLGMPVVGGMFQEAAAMISLNELAYATAVALIPVPKLLSYDNQRRAEIKHAGLELLKSVGGIDILNSKDRMAELYRSAAEQDSQEGVALIYR